MVVGPRRHVAKPLGRAVAACRGGDGRQSLRVAGAPSRQPAREPARDRARLRARRVRLHHAACSACRRCSPSCLALLLRASVPAAIIGTFVGNPLSWPFIWVSTYVMGLQIVGLEGVLDPAAVQRNVLLAVGAPCSSPRRNCSMRPRRCSGRCCGPCWRAAYRSGCSRQQSSTIFRGTSSAPGGYVL